MDRDDEDRELFARMLRAFEEGWPHVAPLQAYCDGRRTRIGKDDDEGAVLQFLEVEIVDLFRSLAFACAESIPGGERRSSRELSVEELQSEAHLLVLQVRLAVLAVADSSIPDPLRDVVRERADALLPAARRIETLVRELAG
jgi:hypothetical protein